MIAKLARDPWGRDLKGQLRQLTFSSRLLADNPLGDPAERPLWAYTPPGWPDAGPYRAIWCIQGFTGQVDMWRNRSAFEPTLIERVDSAMAAGEIPEAVVVFPDAWSSYGGSQFLDSPAVGRYRSYLCEELVPFADRELHLVPKPQGRALLGKSSGGYGAVMLGLERSDVWGGFAALAPDAAFEYCYLPDFPLAWKALAKHEHSVDRFWAAVMAQERRSGEEFAAINCIAMAACYSPGPNGDPELPWASEDCRLREDVWARWLDRDPVRVLARRLAGAQELRAISLECGRSDEFRLYAGARMLHRQLEEAGIDHRFELFEGTHGGLQHRYPAALRYLMERMR